MVKEKVKSDAEKIKYMKDNLCFSCGNEREDKSKQLCNYCQSLSDQAFFPVPTVKDALIYFRKYLKKRPSAEESASLIKTYADAKKNDIILGMQPSQCPYCNLMSKGAGVLVGYKKDSKEYKQFVIGKEIPKLVCKRCGDLAMYTHYQYDFTTEQSVKILELVNKIIVKQRKDKNKSGDGTKVTKVNKK